jgi:hypothetical protein
MVLRRALLPYGLVRVATRETDGISDSEFRLGEFIPYAQAS